jgi:hypothetical protein
MPFQYKGAVRSFRRALRYAFYDWTREMPVSKRVITWAAILIQGYAIYALWARSFIWPFVWPKGPILDLYVWLLYLVGYGVLNAMLTSEFVRKTQLESDQVAAQQIQRTLIPQKLGKLRGYDMETFYRPFRHVGGDYFDMIELTNGQTLLTIADVAGKGMAAALLAANIQALVRVIAGIEGDPLAIAKEINEHLYQYTPDDRFATAVFLVLNRDSGELTYVNAGHNAPIVSIYGSVTSLKASGPPLGLFSGAEYEAGTAAISPGGSLLLFTDGLTDSIQGNNPEQLLCKALAGTPGVTIADINSLVDPTLSEDDVTILLVKRNPESTSRRADAPSLEARPFP